ncbi:MAG: hypothetical protein E6H04_02510 [Bacillati bacterium ANGP1]|uniref:Uncharacterized protein n=1 Tax=Candidatus Segetimicrobium genomatis TaxID=2569760 RepID=A0A537JJI5_9BACT|nr:MAG: hypothetical protein E6H04_02510 [Terrabacteria group bacterium ANGP1]
MRTSVCKSDARTRDEILDGSGHHYFARPCLLHDPRSDVHCDPAHLIAHPFDLTSMQSGPDLNPQ